MRDLAKSLLLGLGVGLGAPVGSTFAQCAMCRTAVAGSSSLADIARVLNTAILALLIPPVAILGVVFWLALTVWNQKESWGEGSAETPESLLPLDSDP